MAGTSQVINLTDEQERALITYASKAKELLINQYSMRNNMELIDRAYMREENWTEDQIRSKLLNRLGDKHRIQDVTVPIIMPQVESAVGYLANAFLTGYPVFGVSSDPNQEDSALQMETIIAENAITARWRRQLLMFFRDGLKYNLHGLELSWEQRTVAKITNAASAPNGAKVDTDTLWRGNVIRRMDLYNTFFDPRVSPSDIYCDGEFAGYIKLYSRIKMKQLINDLYGSIPKKTAIKAFESGPAPGGGTSTGTPFNYYRPLINPYPTMINTQYVDGFNWESWFAGGMEGGKLGGIQYKNAYEVMFLYARILPSDFNLSVPAENTPQVWKIIIVNGKVVLFLERQSNAHNHIPIYFGQPIEDGLDFQTKSFASNVQDMQDVASALVSGYIASKRRLVGDRVLYDPSKIRAKDINSTHPAAKIPVRQSAYGRPLGEAVYQFPYRDESVQTMMQGAQIITQWADKINGQNAPQQGQFQKGNKTKYEYEDIMGHGNTHNQVMGIESEEQVFVPLKEAIKLNILQFQQQDILYNRDKNTSVAIKPETLREAAVHFKVSDGMSPEELMMNEDEWQTAMQTIGSSQQIGAGYNMAPMFTYLMKLKGCDLTPFEKSPLQQQYEAAVAQWQQVALAAVKAGQPVPPQPKMPPELIAELKAKGQTGGLNPAPQETAESSTQGP